MRGQGRWGAGQGEVRGRAGDGGAAWPGQREQSGRCPLSYPPGRRGLVTWRLLLQAVAGPRSVQTSWISASLVLGFKDAVLTAERLPGGLTEVGGMDHCQPSPAEVGSPAEPPRVPAGACGSSGHFPRRALLRAGHCHWGPSMGGEAQREVGGAPQAAPASQPQGPPSLAQGAPKPSPPSGHPVFSGAAPCKEPWDDAGPPRNPGGSPSHVLP